MSRRLVCRCGAGLVWVPYFRASSDEASTAATPADKPNLSEPRSVLPFDRRPVYSPQPQWAKAEYALLFGNTSARRITPATPLDPVLERAHTIHFATCPQHITADELAAWSRHKSRSKTHRPPRPAGARR